MSPNYPIPRLPARRVPRLALVLILSALGSLAATSRAAAEESSPYGINVHVPQGEELRRLLDRTQAAGIGWIRIDFVWGFVEPRQDVFDWSLYDAIAAAAGARGIEVYATLAYTPAWATTGPETVGVPSDPDDWADFCFRAARRYRGKIRHWGLWNEPNLDRFWAGTRRQYIDVILKRGADAVHAGNPEAQVGGPELAHLTAGDADWYDWLLQTVVEGRDRLDFVTHHLYDEDGPRDVTEKLAGSTRFANRPDLWDVTPPSVREVLKEAGWSGRPVWLTEVGWATDRISEAQQAANYTGLLSDWFPPGPGRDLVDKVFFYEVKDAPPAFGVPLWGILRADYSAKPAFGAYRDFIAAHPGTAGPPDVPAEPLALFGGRFHVTVRWRDHLGNVGAGHGLPGAGQTGFFWFFNSSNTELVAKVIDAGEVNGKFWFFYGALSDVEYWVDVRDTATGAVRRYHNPPGTYCGKADTSAFPSASTTAAAESAGPATLAAGAEGALSPAAFEGFPMADIADIAELGDLAGPGGLAALSAPATAACGPDVLCLFGGRFRVEVDWRTPDGRTGRGMAVPQSDLAGTFWFFNPANVELAVKVLDARSINNRFWVFYGAVSDVAYTVRVTDTTTTATRTYSNQQGSFCGRADTSAF